MWSKYVSNNVWKNIKLPVSAFATVARKICNFKFTVIIDFPIRHFILPLMTLTMKA